MTEPIYTPWNQGLGDRWASTNLLIRLAAAKHTQIRVSYAGRRQLHDEIMSVLAAPRHAILYTDEPGTVQLDGFNVWAAEFYPTYTQWSWRNRAQRVTVHFDGVSAAEDKNPPTLEKQRLLATLVMMGYEIRFLHGKMPLTEVVDELAESLFFISVDSGFAHIAHSVGVPIFLLQYKLPVVTCHRGKKYVLCDGIGDLLDHKLPNWLSYRKFLGF